MSNRGSDERIRARRKRRAELRAAQGRVAKMPDPKRELKEKAAAQAENEKAARRNRLVSLATQPLATQIKEFGSMDAWHQEYLGIENNKVRQIEVLKQLEERLWEERIRSEISLDGDFHFGDLPLSKRQQYDQGLQTWQAESEWDRCRVRVYIAAEWAFEKWAKEAGLDCVDLNVTDPYGPQDYRVRRLNENGYKDVDVKTTISVGRAEQRCYWSPDGHSDGEIICAVRSDSDKLDSLISRHHIQGIFHSRVYDGIEAKLKQVGKELKQLTGDKPLLNACYFHSPWMFFGVSVRGASPAPPAPPIDGDVIEYCAENREYLPAIFHLNSQDAAPLLRKALPECHHDFVPVAAELMKGKQTYLLPHYLADYCLTKILAKEPIDTEAVEKVIWSVFKPLGDQKRYLESLMQAWEVLPTVRCASHPDEGIEDMDINVVPGGEKRKLILRAQCSTIRELTTTILAYSRKTGETLVYGSRDSDGHSISVCDAEGCGCLTHMHNFERIGRKRCPRYGAAPLATDDGPGGD